MKYIIYSLLLTCSPLFSQASFDNFFTGKRIQMEYYFKGDAEHSEFIPNSFTLNPQWGGSHTNLIDSFEYGELIIYIHDSISGKLIYSRSYSTLSNEWQSTAEAKLAPKIFVESQVFPEPKNTVQIKLGERNSEQDYEILSEFFYNPHDWRTNRELNAQFDTRKLHDAGQPSKKLDIAFVAEGYTEKEKERFYEDAKKYMEYLFGWSPFDELQDKINIWASFVPSEESGVDIPGDSIWINTSLKTHFYTFGVERYLTAPNLSLVHQHLSQVPYDQVCILVNSEKYGGGGILNYYNIFTAHNEYSEFLFLHEFGHGFAGLADEYYTSETAYEDFFDKRFEPKKPNITTLVDFESKWKHLIHDSIPIPTPDTEQYEGIVGTFEGGGYVPKGIYRPVRDCSMKSKINNAFCPVCKEAIRKMVLFYSE